jgi:rhodanese-related sulfurtransferase
MKKFLLVLTVFFAVFGLVACQQTEEPDYTLPEEITMENLDEYINYPNVEIIDLRNWQDKMNGGYIRGSHFIPFFQYLESEEILVRVDGWNFSADAIKDENALRNIFDEDMDIILLCAGGTRAGFVREALLELGYENVWNVGAFGDYNGEYKVFGDGEYVFPPVAE